jgi:hypothetical protein
MDDIEIPESMSLSQWSENRGWPSLSPGDSLSTSGGEVPKTSGVPDDDVDAISKAFIVDSLSHTVNEDNDGSRISSNWDIDFPDVVDLPEMSKIPEMPEFPHFEDDVELAWASVPERSVGPPRALLLDFQRSLAIHQ